MGKKELVLVLDGKYYLYRSLKANVQLSHHDIVTTVYYNYLNSIKSMCKKFKPDNIIVMWDSEYSKRKEFYPHYKTKDESKKDEMIQEQIRYIKFEYDTVKKILAKLGIVSYNRYGLEADDLFFYFINQNPDKGIFILSRDEDLYQLLIFKNCRIYNPHEKRFIDRQAILEKYGIEPEQWILYKSINGCKSDTVEGIPGIGDGRTIDYILQRAKPMVAERIKDNWDIVVRNRQLVALPYLPVKEVRPLEYKQSKINIDYLTELCFNFGFKNFLENIDEWKDLLPLENKDG